jgi:hypothetical protein
VADVLRDHVVLEYEAIDRMYLNVYVPHLQTVGATVGYLRVHRGQRFASTTAVAPMSEAFVRNIERFVAAEGVDLIAFQKSQRKDDITQTYLRKFKKTEGVLYVGKAQEKARIMRTERRRCSRTGEVDEHLLHGRVVHADLVVAARPFQRAVLQPVERGLAGQRLRVVALGFQRVGQQAERRIAAQLVVVIEVLVAERQPMDALRHQRLELVHDEGGIVHIAKAARDLSRQPHRQVRLAQQRRPSIRRDRTAVESTHNLAPLEPFKRQLRRATLCPHRPGPFDQQKCLFAQLLSLIRPGRCQCRVRNAG